MLRIAVISGKGGSGKSSVSSSLASELSKSIRLVLLDADSDCPNQHILFKAKEVQSYPISVSKIARLDPSLCAGCAECLKACPYGAMKMEGGKPAIDPVRCEGCAACVVSCPHRALDMVPKRSGDMVEARGERFPLVFGRLLPGLSSSGKMVMESRKKADEIAKGNGSSLVLIDAPPGIGCPVIAAISGCDLVIGVAEPTPAGLSNLERALALAAHFRIPSKLILNKQGLNPDLESRILAKHEDKVIGTIPYDEEVPHSLSSCIPPIMGKGPASASLKLIAKRVKSIIDGL